MASCELDRVRSPGTVRWAVVTRSDLVMRGAAVTGLAVPASDQGIGRHRTDRGSATVVMLGVIGAVLLLTISGLVLASAVLASHRARAAADLAALAASGMLMRGEPASAACAAGAEVAAVNHARLQQCIASATEVRLSVVVTAGVKGVGIATARSRAGPGASGG